MNLLETSAFIMIWRRGERERCCSNKVKLFGQNDVERRKGKRDVCYSTFHFHQDTRSVYIYIYTAIHVTERGRRNRKENSRPRDEKNRKVVTGIRVRKLSVSPGKRCFPLLNTKKGARHSLGEFANGYVRK